MRNPRSRRDNPSAILVKARTINRNFGSIDTYDTIALSDRPPSPPTSPREVRFGRLNSLLPDDDPFYPLLLLEIKKEDPLKKTKKK